MAFMKKTRLYLIDIDLHYLEQTFQYLSATRDVEVVGYAVDAAQAQLQIARLDPDCIVLGLALRSCYGLALLRILRAIPSQPALIVCTAFPSETAMRMCRDVGADMFLSKPVTMADLHACILETAQAKRRALAEKRALEDGQASPSPTVRIRYALLHANVAPRLFGFSCLAEALYLLWDNERLLHNMRRNLYPRLAETLSTTPENVERNMRTAIRRACGAGEGALSNRVFLLRMLRKLREDEARRQDALAIHPHGDLIG